jgi:hypothetical protein
MKRGNAGFKRSYKVVHKVPGRLFTDRMEQDEEISAKFLNARYCQDNVAKHPLERV